MKKTEAIAYLQPIADSSCVKRYSEALNLAISALRAEVKTNLQHQASNEQVTEPLHTSGFSDSEESLATKNQVKRDGGNCNFRNNHLISVDEQLPEEAIRVLVRLGGINPPIGFPRMDTDRIIDGRWVRWGDLVTHWMPLPDLPKEA